MFKNKNATTHLSYRELKEHEIDKLVMVYERNNCNILQTTKDKECLFKGRPQLTYYRDYYNFDTRINKLRKKLINHYIKNSTDILMKAKLRAIKRAMDLLEDRIFEKVSLITGDTYKIKVPPSNKDIKIAYEIIKTELGEPINVKEIKGLEDSKLILNNIQVLFKDFENNEDNTKQDIQTPIHEKS
jgi:hypothetical protein